MGVLIVSEGSSTIVNESQATKVINKTSLKRWLKTTPARDMKNFANEPLPAIIMKQTRLASSGSGMKDIKNVVVRDGIMPLIGSNLFAALDISVT